MEVLLLLSKPKDYLRFHFVTIGLSGIPVQDNKTLTSLKKIRLAAAGASHPLPT